MSRFIGVPMDRYNTSQTLGNLILLKEILTQKEKYVYFILEGVQRIYDAISSIRGMYRGGGPDVIFLTHQKPGARPGILSTFLRNLTLYLE